MGEVTPSEGTDGLLSAGKRATIAFSLTGPSGVDGVPGGKFSLFWNFLFFFLFLFFFFKAGSAGTTVFYLGS